jgi:hypothetical protein
MKFLLNTKSDVTLKGLVPQVSNNLLTPTHLFNLTKPISEFQVSSKAE